MLKNEIVNVERQVCVCDRCGRKMYEDDQVEWQNRLVVSFRAGYGSVFDDGNLVEADICQHCFAAAFGRYLQITRDHPFEQKHPLQQEPQGIFDPAQLGEQQRCAAEREEFIAACRHALEGAAENG